MKLKSHAMLFLLTLATASCGSRGSAARGGMEPVYDKKTGKLQLLKYDSDGNGKVDTWSYMDGARVVRIELDKDEDGKIERWEHYGPGQKLEKVGFSRSSDGKENAWSFAGRDGSVARIEVSARRDGKITRVEHFEKDRLVSAEEDTDGNGTMDKWETYDGDRLSSVAFDTVHRGSPDRRLIYAVDGTARLEVDANGSGRFVAVNNRAAAGAAGRRINREKP